MLNEDRIELIEKHTDALTAEIVNNNLRIEETIKKIDMLLVTKPEIITPSEEKRLADLEVRMAKLWSVLLEETPSRKEPKITKFGKGFKTRFRSKL